MDVESEKARFKKDWEIDFGKKIIRRKSEGILRYLVNILKRPKYPIIALYRFAQSELGLEEGIVCPNFIERGAGNEVAGVPSWYEISEQWSIPKKDLKCLVFGPLVQGREVIVPLLPKRGLFIISWDIIIYLAALGGAIEFATFIIKSVLGVLNKLQ